MRKKIGCSFLTASFLMIFMSVFSQADTRKEKEKDRSLSAFPILMYDTDIGVGYGAKAKFVDYFAGKESFDFILFNSSKGERWYVFTFSTPDIEIRQGKRYPFSLDIKAEYDKFLKYYYYGMGSASKEEEKTEFSFEKKELQFKVGRGFTPHFVAEVIYVLRSVRYYNIEEGPFEDILQEVGDQFSPFATLLLRYDTSDSQIHPKRGCRILFQNDWAGKFLGNKDARFHRFSLDLRKFTLLFGMNDVLAFRLLIQKISGAQIPLFEMSVLGGGSEMDAMRGFKLNRFLDKGKFLFNAEYRFPLWKKLGGNVFLDAGHIWSSWKAIDLMKSVLDFGWGLRYYLHHFVVRFDMGFSDEGTGIYFNFGHIF
jgi:outer membrane protein assembly factor BamA